VIFVDIGEIVIPPPISTKITPLFNSLSDGQHSTNINKNHLSPKLIE
jgi:hypothetical protein